MARVNGIFNITGSLQNVSFYTMKGSDKVYVRTKGGPSSRRMKTGPEFELIRKHQKEWKGCVKFSGYFKGRLDGIYRMRDYNVSPVLNGIAKKIMKLDTENEIGKRSILLSKSQETFEGFNLNRRFPFNAVFRTSLQVEIDRQQSRMVVRIPRMATANDLYNVQNLPYFRLTFNLSRFSDMVFSSLSDNYITAVNDRTLTYVEKSTEWFSANDVISEQTLVLDLEKVISEDDMKHITWMGSAGIEFGNAGVGGTIEAVKHACCAKILSVV